MARHQEYDTEEPTLADVCLVPWLAISDVLRSAQPAEYGICPFIWLWKRGGMDLGLLLEGIANASLNQGMLSAVLRDVMV